MIQRVSLAAALFLSTAAAAQVPHQFEAGTAAKASEVNANFDYLAQAQAASDDQVSALSTEVSDLQSHLGELQERVDQLFPEYDGHLCASIDIGAQDTYAGVRFISSAFTLMDIDGTQNRLQLMVPLAPQPQPEVSQGVISADFAGSSKHLKFCQHTARLDNVFRVAYDLSDAEQVTAHFYTEARLTVTHPEHGNIWFSNEVRFDLGQVSFSRDDSGDYQLQPEQLPSLEAIEAALLGGYQVYFHSSLR
ncbi:hypothetical protein [Ferrimonas balearica]|uniref:hypothetical protein n=1 Tax=Ferrimonas balearica TaxID=44012 RepID=UPI001C98EBD1|nr:hypothetical protein [Ferrimonas balearica]MBY5994022.1 hypothetical protein [Ferrimonas balearica]